MKSKIYTLTMITIGNNNNSIKFLYIHMYIHTYMLNMISVLLRCKDHYKILLRRTVLAPNTSKFLQTLAADAHLAEGQFLLEGQTLNKEKSLIYRAGTRRPTISKTEGQNLEPR
jgi:hypothetical protein